MDLQLIIYWQLGLTVKSKCSDFRILTRLNFNYRSGHSSLA